MPGQRVVPSRIIGLRSVLQADPDPDVISKSAEIAGQPEPDLGVDFHVWREKILDAPVGIPTHSLIRAGAALTIRFGVDLPLVSRRPGCDKVGVDAGVAAAAGVRRQ